MVSLRTILFGEAITDRHRDLCDVIPYPWLGLNRDLAIRRANPQYLCATFKDLDFIVGVDVFDAFPDKPGDPEVNGVENLSASLLQVLSTREPNRMITPQRYDIQTRSGVWLVRYWRPINTPVLDHNGEVCAIIHHVENVTDAVLSPKFGRNVADQKGRFVATPSLALVSRQACFAGKARS